MNGATLICDACPSLKKDATIRGWRETAGKDLLSVNVPLGKHGHVHHQRHLQEMERRKQQLRNAGVARGWKIKRFELRIHLFNDLLQAIANADIPRIKVLIGNWLKAKMGHRRIISKIHAVATGKEQLYSYSLKDYELSLFLLRIGGNRLVNIFHKAANFPSIRQVQRFVSHLQLWIPPERFRMRKFVITSTLLLCLKTRLLLRSQFCGQFVGLVCV
ncbi:hypothetical protein BT69DRAFT_431852 [Atractiella rhizophila]|nr:hypothetical protein BT69DRAFT_431852 [Atractiella rhizophila]